MFNLIYSFLFAFTQKTKIIKHLNEGKLIRTKSFIRKIKTCVDVQKLGS